MVPCREPQNAEHSKDDEQAVHSAEGRRRGSSASVTVAVGMNRGSVTVAVTANGNGNAAAFADAALAASGLAGCVSALPTEKTVLAAEVGQVGDLPVEYHVCLHEDDGEHTANRIKNVVREETRPSQYISGDSDSLCTHAHTC